MAGWRIFIRNVTRGWCGFGMIAVKMCLATIKTGDVGKLIRINGGGFLVFIVFRLFLRFEMEPVLFFFHALWFFWLRIGMAQEGHLRMVFRIGVPHCEQWYFERST